MGPRYEFSVSDLKACSYKNECFQGVYSLNETTQCFTGCPFEWLNYRDKCYFFSKDMHSFDDAKATCEESSASLVIINDMEEQVTHYFQHSQEEIH